MSTLETIKELLRYESWADSQVLASVEKHGVWTDQDVRDRLHHVLVVQRIYLRIIKGKKPDLAKLEMPFASLADMLPIAMRYRKGMRKFVDRLKKKDFARKVRVHWFGKKDFTLLQVLYQVVLHSQHHRGQTAMRLKQLGHVPPTFDYIVWIANGKPGANV